MVNSGQEGQLYPELNPFTVRETDKFLAVYILHGFSPSPRVDMKFKPQEDDPINGSDLVYRILGPNDERHHRHFILTIDFDTQSNTIFSFTIHLADSEDIDRKYTGFLS